MSKVNNKNVRGLVILALLSALLIVMAITPLGYLKIGPLSITLNMSVVAVGAAATGPIGGLVLGIVFGLTSFAQCLGTDPFGVFLLNVNPVFTFITCVATRALAGWLTGMLCKFLGSRIKSQPVGYAITGFAASILNTLLFVFTMLLLFGTSTISDACGSAAPMSALAIITAFITINAVFEAIAAVIITCGVCTALLKSRLLNKPIEQT